MYTKVLTLVALVCSARAGLIGAPALSSIGIAAPAYAGHGYGLAAGPAIAAGPFLGGHGFGLAGHAIAAPAIAAAPAIFKAPIAAPAIVKAAAAPAIDYVAYPKYSFNYGVADGHTGDQKTQQEVRDGDVVKGSYSLQEPDGTIRTVHYTADDHNGFNAVVTRSGHAVHPETAHIAKTVVAAAPLAYAAPAKALFAAPAAIASPALAYGGLGHLGGFAYKG